MNNSYRIVRVRAVEGGARLLVELEWQECGECCHETLSLLSGRMTRLPEIGPVTPETVEDLRHKSQVCAAIGAGLRALGATGSSRRHLTQKLCARGFAYEIAKEAVEELAEKGYLKEEEGALREAEKNLAKLWGDRRILADLRAKGYAAGALKYAAARLRAENGTDRCALLIRKRRMAFPTDDASLRKFMAALARYGYSQAEIKAAMKIRKN